MFGCGNIVLLAMRFFDVVKFTVLTPFSLRRFVESHSQLSIRKHAALFHVIYTPTKSNVYFAIFSHPSLVALTSTDWYQPKCQIP